MAIFLFLAALVFLGWGFYRAKPLGKLGLLNWSQSVALITPWLILFGLMGVGIVPNLAVILLLIVLSTGGYIFLGNRIRALTNNQAVSTQTVTPANNTTPKDTESALQEKQLSSEEALEESPAKVGETRSSPDSIPVPADDLAAIKGVFGIDTFFATKTIPYQDGIIFQGNLRGEADDVHRELTEKLMAALGDRYRLFLVHNTDEKPIVIVLPSSRDPKSLSILQKGVALFLALATLGTCLFTAATLQSFNLLEHPERIGEAWPIGLGIFMVLVVHEIGHWILARRCQVCLSWPFFFPALQIGSFGSFNRFESHIPNRNVLFDVALAGPAAGGIFSFLLLVAGFWLSNPNSQFQVPSLFFQGSALVGTLARVALNESLQETVVAVHPLVIIGWIGLVISALNLMPAGQLDGGRIIQAIYGRKVAGRTTVVTLIVLAVVSLVNPLALYWGIIILFWQRDLERPSLDEISEPDDTRAALGLFALFLMVAVLIPLTPSLAGRLGIGG